MQNKMIKFNQILMQENDTEVTNLATREGDLQIFHLKTIVRLKTSNLSINTTLSTPRKN